MTSDRYTEDIRWTARRKAEVVCGIRDGTLRRATVMRKYAITEDELAEWEARYDADGPKGLRVTIPSPSRITDPNPRRRRKRPKASSNKPVVEQDHNS